MAQSALGQVNYDLKDSEIENQSYRRSLYAVTNIAKGEKITADNMRSIRPGLGLKPKYYDQAMGKTAKNDIDRGTPLSWDLLD